MALRGFTDLHAIEISHPAIELLRATYPSLADVLTIYEGTAEDWLVRFTPNQFSVTFAMGVLQHIHPDSSFVFEEMARVTKDEVIIMESERHTTQRTFERNYKKVFEQLGMVQIFEDETVPSLPGICRVFSHSEARIMSA